MNIYNVSADELSLIPQMLSHNLKLREIIEHTNR